MKIEVDLPFTFCEDCHNLELQDVAYFVDGIAAQSGRYCEHAGICIRAVEEYQKRLDDGRPVRPEERSAK